jgi:hypothetical protein
MVVCFWSPKGGSGTSTVAAAFAGVLASLVGGVRAVDLAGDLPALLGCDHDPDRGVADWLALGVAAPADALGRLTLAVDGDIGLVPLGSVDALRGASPESGAALATVLQQGAVPAVVDAGRAEHAAVRGVAAVADHTWLVVRPCYTTLRRAVRHELLEVTTGIVFVDEPGRTLSVRDVAEVLGRPVVARVPWRVAVARRADSGRIAVERDEPLWRPLRRLADAAGGASGDGAAACARRRSKAPRFDRPRSRRRCAPACGSATWPASVTAMSSRARCAAGWPSCCTTRRPCSAPSTSTPRSTRCSTTSSAWARWSRCSPTRPSPRSW